MGLMPDQFWSLTVHEFWLKYRGFLRDQDRRESELMRQDLRRGNYKQNERMKLQRAANVLKRYPLKKWLMVEGS